MLQTKFLPVIGELTQGILNLKKTQYLHIVPEEVAPVFVFQLFTRQQRKHKVFWRPKQAVLSHAGNP